MANLTVDLANPVSHRIGSVSFVAADRLGAARFALARAVNLTDSGSHIHLANAYSLALADSNDTVRRSLSGDSTNFADGKPLTWVSTLKRHSPRIVQVRGPQLFRDVFDLGRVSEVKHFLLGSSDETLAQLQYALEKSYPGVQIAGTFSPPFRAMSSEELSAQDEKIAASGAQIVWVGLGTPKQDLEAFRLAFALPVVAIAVGAAFDFVAGSVKESPRWISKLGFEWVYRLAMEPRRLWRRYLFGNARFLWSVAKNWNK